MSSATLTIVGLYSYNPNLFSKMVLPDGIDRDLLIDTIVMRGGDYEVVYPNPELMEHLIGTWSRTWLPTFTNWKRASDDISQVAPLENYDRIENWTDTTQEHRTDTTQESQTDTVQDTTESTGNTSTTGNTTGSDSSHGTGTVTNNTTNNSTNTSKISAEDNTDFVNKTQDIESSTQNNTQGNTTDTSASTSTNSTSNTDSESNMSHNAESNMSHDAESNMSHDAESVHGGRVHGNIGVTTSAQMYAEFLTTLHKFGNIYEAIASTFCQNFVIPII